MEDYCGLPFVTVPNKRGVNDYMTIGALVEKLILLKKYKDIYYPEDEIINLACNIIDRLPRDMNVYDWLEKNTK
jgi:hypothetical protein